MTYMHKTLIAAAIAACAVAAQADPMVTVKFDSSIFGSTGSDTVNIHLTGSDSFSVNNVLAGRFHGKATHYDGIDGSQFVDGADSLWLYCYDIYQSISGGNTVDYRVDFDGAMDRTLAFLGAVNWVLSSGSEVSDPYAWLHPTTTAQSAAIQLGIWESQHDDGDWDMTGGNFRVTGIDSATQAELDKFFLAAEDGVSPLGRQYTMVLRSGQFQDMITGDPPPPPGNSVPEPGTLSLLLASAGALALGRRRRRS